MDIAHPYRCSGVIFMGTTTVIVRSLRRFVPKSIGSDQDRIVVGEPEDCAITYYAEPYGHSSAERQFNHFPIILDTDRSPWKHGNLYLLYKLESFKLPHPKTLESICADLRAYKNFIDENSIDYLTFPIKKYRRPTYQFRAHLQDQINTGEITSSTASRKMSSVIGFYRWMIRQHDCCVENPPWEEKDTYINFHDHVGFIQTKKIISTDLSVRGTSKQKNTYEFIQDGGKLRPLTREDQEALIKALIKIGNPEMKLAFLIALTTGARIQSVFTIKLSRFLSNEDDNQGHLSVKIGSGTGIDSKYQKRMCLYIPTWVVKLVRVYINSARSKRRQHKAIDKNFKEQYLFLTQAGSPYYISSIDTPNSNFINPPRGNAVRQFIKAQLIPELKKMGNSFPFRFHDLRATYGINLLEEKINVVENGRGTLFDLLMLIKERMGHSQIATTEHYLNYKKKRALTYNAQSDFENYLINLLESEK